ESVRRGGKLERVLSADRQAAAPPAVHAGARAGNAEGVRRRGSDVGNGHDSRKRPPDRRALCVRAVSAGQRCAYPTRNLLRVWKSLNVFSGTSKLVASRRCGLAPIQSASEIDS